MLTPEELQLLPVYLVEMYSELSEFVLSDIARRISEGAKITDTAEYQMYRAQALGQSSKEISAKMAEINGLSTEEIDELIQSAAKRSDEFQRRMLGAGTASDTEQLLKLCKAEMRNANGAVKNLTGTLGFAELGADGKVFYSSTTDFLQKTMDAAHLKVASGTTDHITAVRQACNKLAASGLRTVYYESGHSDRIEVAVRRAVMTSVSQVTQQISELNSEEFGANGWEISAHSGARPSHAIYQGRQYPQEDYERIVLPLIDDYNCRHSAFPIIMGVTPPSYTEEELKNLDPPPFIYDGRRYTAYEAQQQMRFMERQMRKQKDRCIVANAAGDKETFTAHSIKLRRQKDIYENFCEAAGCYTEYERTVVMGYNRHLSGKTGAVTRKTRAFDRAQMKLDDKVYHNSLDKYEKGGILIGRYNPQDIRRAKKQIGTNFVTTDINNPESLYGENAEHIPPKAGFYDIKAHGDPQHVKIFDSVIDAKQLADIIISRDDYKYGTPIRLLCCDTGKGENCFAKQLANILGVDVEAPTEEIQTLITGEFEVFTFIGKNKRRYGDMKIFHPKGKE